MKAAKTDLLRKIIMPVLAVALSLALGAVIIVAAGRDPPMATSSRVPSAACSPGARRWATRRR